MLQMVPALPKTPLSVITSTSIVGFPLESKMSCVNFNDNTHITLILNLIIQIYSIFCYHIVKIMNVINENVITNCKKIN
jgi:hypothetical protein